MNEQNSFSWDDWNVKNIYNNTSIVTTSREVETDSYTPTPISTLQQVVTLNPSSYSPTSIHTQEDIVTLGQRGSNLRQNSHERNQQLRERFDVFWSAYPRKVHKADAVKMWERLAPDDHLLDVMLAALEWQVRSDQWTRDGGRFIPHPSTWLNGRRWEDEQQIAPPPTAPIRQTTRSRTFAEIEAEALTPLTDAEHERLKRRLQADGYLYWGGSWDE